MVCSGLFCICFSSITLILDVDECQSNLDNCDVNADCSNTEGSYICLCNVGYSGNGFNCSG